MTQFVNKITEILRQKRIISIKVNGVELSLLAVDLYVSPDKAKRLVDISEGVWVENFCPQEGQIFLVYFLVLSSDGILLGDCGFQNSHPTNPDSLWVGDWKYGKNGEEGDGHPYGWWSPANVQNIWEEFAEFLSGNAEFLARYPSLARS